MSSRCRQTGFTLVETLVAGMILALAAATLSVAARQSMRSLAMSRDLQTAAELADQILTRIDTLGPAAVIEQERTAGAFASPHERFAWDASIIAMDDGDLYDVTVSVTWDRPDRSIGSTEIQTLLRDSPGSHPTSLVWEDL